MLLYVDEKRWKALIKKYGKPDEDIVIWSNDSFKTDSSGYGTAVKKGHLIFLTEWDKGMIPDIRTNSIVFNIFIFQLLSIDKLKEEESKKRKNGTGSFGDNLRFKLMSSFFIFLGSWILWWNLRFL